MNTSVGLVGKSLAVAVAIALCGAFGAGQASAADIGRDDKPGASEHWSAWGGTVGVRWNRELAQDIGLIIGQANGKHAQLSWREHEMFDLRQTGSLEFDVRNSNLHDFIGGSLQARGGYVIESPAGRIDLSDFRLSPRAGDELILDIVGGDGKAWFYIDRLMYELIDGNQRLAVRTMDLRVSPELAERLGHPEVANWAIADMQMTTDVLRQGANPQQPSGGYKWHGTPVPGAGGAVYQADLFMQTFNAQYSRCDGCTGEGGSGRVVFTPSSTLRNNVNNGTQQVTIPSDPLGTSSALYAADIPWWQKFTGNHEPYGNDQHPFLIWNLYRLNADGSIDQIGRSGVKHAFLTTNSGCLDHPGTSQVLGRGCSDTYGTGNNDSNSDLGPRSEIVPATNQWGRCGSIYDTNCDGSPNNSGNGNFDQRMITVESQFSGPAQAGATYLFESWYLARQDINIYNSMATKRVTFTRNSSTWSIGGNDQYRLGPAIDRWVDPSAPGANARSVALSSNEGNTKVAVKVTDLGGGQWRYDYAVMNLDFARAKTEGSEPNLRVLSNMGYDSFSVPVGNATITNIRFSDGDVDAGNDWGGAVYNGSVLWATPNKTNPLNWGTMFRFSFVANQAPAENAAELHIAEAGTPRTVAANGVLAPVAARPKASFGNNAP